MYKCNGANMNARIFDSTKEQQALRIIGVDMGLARIRSAIIQEGKVISDARLPIRRHSPDEVIPLIHTAVGDVLKKEGMQLEEIAGIGIGIPGLVNHTTRKIIELPNMDGWKDVKLADRLTSQLKKGFKGKVPPVLVDNDANAAALGLHYSTKCRNMVYLTISTGIGAGVIIEGKVLRGAKGSAAELGHMIIEKGGEFCTGCKMAGCLEAYASGKAIAQQAESHRSELGIGDDEQGEEWPAPIVRMVVQAYWENNSDAQEIVDQATNALAIAIVNITNTFNPEKIILGGFVTSLIGELIIERAEGLLRDCFLLASHDVTIQKNIKDIATLGAGALVCEHLENL
jgi:glucokinase